MSQKLPPLPVNISVGYQDIKIIFHEFIESEQGCYISDKAEIRLQKDMSPIENLNTMLHECLHAACYVYGIKSEFKDNEHEERIVNVLGNALTEIFKRNPKMVDWVKENAKA